jgi:alpha-1,2-mannosyltransferase
MYRAVSVTVASRSKIMMSLRSMRSSAGTRIVIYVSLALVAAGSISDLMVETSNSTLEAGSRIGLDYWVFLAAGDVARTGMDGVLYTEQFLSVGSVDFVYPPWAAIAMIPWTYLPEVLGFVVWTVLGLLLLFLGLRSCGVTNWRFYSILLISLPSVFALGLGQSTFFLVGIAAFAASAMQQNQAGRSGVLISASSWKPHLYGGFVLFWLSDPRQWMAQAVSGLMTLLILGIGSAIILPGAWQDWVSLVTGGVDTLSAPHFSISLDALALAAWGSPESGRWFILVPVAVAMVVVTVVMLRKSVAGLAPRLALALSVGLLIAPHVVIYDAILLSVPLGLAFGTALRRDVVLAGMVLVVGLSLGPWITHMQLDRWGHGINASTVALAGVTVLFAFWVRTGEPFFLTASTVAPTDGGSSGSETATTL